MLAMFTGLETYQYSQGALISLGNVIKEKGCDSWLLKVADGGNQWLSPSVITAIQQQTGLRMLPWMYVYGNTFINTEKAVAQQFIEFGLVLDVEDQFFNQIVTGWKPIHLFGVTSYANPRDNGKGYLWQNLVENFTCDVFLPQVYTSYDMQVWKAQYSGFNCMPAVVPGTLDQAQGFDHVALWYNDTFTTTDVQEVKHIMTQTPTPPNPHVEKQFADLWASSGQRSGTGIYTLLLQKYQEGSAYIGFPVSAEIDTVTPDGQSMIKQRFDGGYVDWYPNGANNAFMYTDTGGLQKLW